MSEKQPLTVYKHTTSYMVRGIPYALTSICALFAGYAIQANSISLPFSLVDLFILIIPIIASIYFFMCYAERYPTPELQVLEEDNVELAIRREAIYIYLILAVSLVCNAVLIALLVAVLSGYQLPLWLIFTFLIHAVMYVYYGLFLWRHPDPHSIPTVRHQLVWAVILSIGISLYYGVSFSNLTNSWLPLIPLFFVVALYIATKKFCTGEISFLVTTLLSFFCSTILAVLIKNDLIPLLPNELSEYFFAIQFCIIVSAYLAVFEAWKVTSDIAKIEQKEIGSVIPENLSSKAHRYSTATLTALMTSVWTLPFFFIFSQYGMVFLITFGFHSFFSFYVWSRWGRGENLIKGNWGFHKIWVGVIFLVILVICSFPPLNKQPSSRTLEDFVSWSGLALPILFAAPLTAFLLNNARNRSGNIWEVFNERINFTRLLSSLSLIGCTATLIVIQPNYDKNSLIYFKGDLAFIFYTICITLCAVAELVYYLSKPKSNTNVLNIISVFLILIRAITSCLIAFAVFFPALYTGRSFWESSVLALPFFLSAIGGFALNDYFDAKKDLINKPYRAIPSGMLSSNFVLLFSIITLGFAFLSAKFFSQNNSQFILYVFCILGVTSYNLFVKYISLTKTFLTSTISAIPILFSVLSFDYPKIYLLLPVATSLFILGREWLMDIRDVKGDAAEEVRTIPMIIGANYTAKFGFGFQVIAVLLLTPIAIYNKSYLSASLVGLILILVMVMIPMWSYRSGLFQQRIVQLLWLPMFLGLLFFISK